MQNAASAYRQNSLESAPPIKVLRLLYEGALRFLDQALALDPASETLQFHDRVRRAEAIVAELRIALEPEHDPKLCEQLEGLYNFVEDELREAFLSREKRHVESAREILQTLSDAWHQVRLENSAVNLGTPDAKGGIGDKQAA